MKNLYVIPTDKPSRLWTNNLRRRLWLDEFTEQHPTNIAKHIYITSSEEINSDTKSCWCLDTKDNSVNYYQGALPLYNYIGYKKIILTTDQDLIKDGVQAIDDEFLEWFVKNPSCEFVEVEEVYPLICCIQKEGKTKMNNGCMERNRCLNYKIIIPREEPKCTCKEHDPYCCLVHGICPTCVKKEEPKQETLEEAIDRIAKEDGYDIDGAKVSDFVDGMVKGAKWQAEQFKYHLQKLNDLCGNK